LAPWQQHGSPTQQQLSTGPAAAAAAAAAGGAVELVPQDATTAAAQRLGASKLQRCFLDRPGQQQEQHAAAAAGTPQLPAAAAASDEDGSDNASAGSHPDSDNYDVDAAWQKLAAELDSVRKRIFARAVRFSKAVDDDDTTVVAAELRSYACSSSSEVTTLMSATNRFLRVALDRITGVTKDFKDFDLDSNDVMFEVDVSTPVRIFCGTTALAAVPFGLLMYCSVLVHLFPN
jgi:hypothetical protein